MVQVPVDDDGALQAQATVNLSLLPPRQRRLLELRYFHGKTLSQAAGELGFRRSWASRLHARALATLGAAMRPHFLYRPKGVNGDERPPLSRHRTRSAIR
jgi:DNA-directed RNA polymerase specialized sigma24 family protein